ncbi:GNAT family N-acetyltransferase [Chroococcidiopsis sp. FACHB-1243]|uniref:GNAT family N-acetyltransferase n=1 Tax=Chroococcidiopsis sp. [FACHB-1243] TaxID=2692781 RepID=UPI00177E24DD|nr:GNAT family N-acetyltransferase [Chroococcidiopsis sp. [FACHB-1243]]MBD2307973.1 GNAT family N-acetyltransferase [Chroococcidiopsis sp. [FACHB-1243]]
MEVFQAKIEYLEPLAILFDQYRVFYGQASDLATAKIFLQERLQKHDSVIFVASDGKIVGFTQLYPSFSSVSMQRIWILNDLFVVATHRRKGIAKLLLAGAKQYAQETGAIRMTLATQISNISAQALYESLGYTRDEEFYHYSLRVSEF